MNKNVNTKEEKKKKEKKKRAAVLLLAGLIGAGALGSLVSTSAFFTDRDHVDQAVNVGTLDMKVDDLTDLDGNYRNWTTRLASTSKLEKNGLQADNWTLPTTVDKDKKQTDFTGIINPGDTGILAFKVSNVAEKSMDTAAVVTVEVELPKGAYDDVKRDGTSKVINYDSTGKALTTAPAVTGASATYNVEGAKAAVDESKDQKALALLADTTTDQGKADAGAYTIEGLGTPVVYQGRFQRDARGEYTDKLIDTDKNVITLRYYTTLETLKGSVENIDGKDNSHGAGTDAIYAYNVDFDRAITNKFQNATIEVNTEVYAKQHRDSFNADTDFKTIDGSQDGSQGTAAVAAGASTDGKYNETGAAQTAKVVGAKEAAAEKATKAIEGENGQSAGRSNVNQTQVVSAKVPTIDLSSDWSMIGSFSHVIDGSTTGTTAPAANTIKAAQDAAKTPAPNQGQ